MGSRWFSTLGRHSPDRQVFGPELTDSAVCNIHGSIATHDSSRHCCLRRATGPAGMKGTAGPAGIVNAYWVRLFGIHRQLD
jgi:hypothetical protein